MRLLIAALADYANIAIGGKLNLSGVFDTIGAPAFPARHTGMVLALRIQFDYDDTSRPEHAIVVSLQDQDGREVVRALGKVAVPAIEPGRRSVVDQLLRFDQVVFERPNEYSFVITWDSVEVQRVPLSVVRRESPPSGPPR